MVAASYSGSFPIPIAIAIIVTFAFAAWWLFFMGEK